MNSDFRARSAWCVVAAPVAGLVVDPILSSFRFAAILALHASAALLVALRLLRVQFLAGDPDKS